MSRALYVLRLPVSISLVMVYIHTVLTRDSAILDAETVSSRPTACHSDAGGGGCSKLPSFVGI